MLLDYYDYIAECASDIQDELEGNESIDEIYEQIGYYIDNNFDEIIASYVMRYGAYTVDNFDEIYIHFEKCVIDNLDE